MARWSTSVGVTTGWVGGLLGESVLYRECSPYFLPANLFPSRWQKTAREKCGEPWGFTILPPSEPLPCQVKRKLLGRSVVNREDSPYFLPANLFPARWKENCWGEVWCTVSVHHTSSQRTSSLLEAPCYMAVYNAVWGGISHLLVFSITRNSTTQSLLLIPRWFEGCTVAQWLLAL